MNAPAEVYGCQALAKETAAELRAKFDPNPRAAAIQKPSACCAFAELPAVLI
jgi:hypothetical protein